jgi:hypothetical protein
LEKRSAAARPAQGGRNEPRQHQAPARQPQPQHDLDPGGGLKDEGDEKDEGEHSDHGRGGYEAANPPPHLGAGEDFFVALGALADGIWGGIRPARADPGHL